MVVRTVATHGRHRFGAVDGVADELPDHGAWADHGDCCRTGVEGLPARRTARRAGVPARHGTARGKQNNWWQAQRHEAAIASRNGRHEVASSRRFPIFARLRAKAELLTCGHEIVSCVDGLPGHGGVLLLGHSDDDARQARAAHRRLCCFHSVVCEDRLRFALNLSD